MTFRAMFRRVTAVAVLGACLAIVACGDSTAPELTPSGAWTLARVNGSPLPALYFLNSAGTVTIERGDLTVRRDGSYSLTQDRRAVFFTGAQFVNTVRDNGTWTGAPGSALFVSTAEPVSFTGTYDARTLRYAVDGVVFEYTR